MKTSKLLLITFVGLLFSIMTVTIDLQNRGQLTSIKELPTAAKSCLQKYFPNTDVAYENIKNEFIKTTKTMGKYNILEQNVYDDDLLAYYNY